jgi:ABC-type multidrug transport system ATPase subunit/pSer/pThr/pTyr-binding forkhead associated (FHA) protein/ABC-type multidrug transport system permease subunit
VSAVIDRSDQAPLASLLVGGRKVALEGSSLTIGRQSVNDVVLDSDSASREHARIERVSGSAYRLCDLSSSNGTYLNGERLHGQSRLLSDGDALRIGGETLHFLLDAPTRVLGSGDAQPRSSTVAFHGDRLTLGRDPRNDLVLTDPSVSRFHAELRRELGEAIVRDLGSSNGTRLDGESVRSAPLAVGSEIGIGSHKLIFDGSAFVLRDDHGGLRLDAEGLRVVAGGRRILDDASLSIAPGELVTIIGASGAGKSTLLKALAGVNVPDAGVVTVNGDPVHSRLSDLGYVPQDDIVHRDLTVTEALSFSARLRLPDDAHEDDVRAAVERVLDELDLTAHAGKRVGRLSGGQRKRVGVATELLNRPGLLFLDEPTTGLDPGLESRSMRLFRRLADNSRAVALVSHATRSLELCDRLVVMGEGGILCFDGPPDAALDFFAVDHYDEIYTQLDERPPASWRERFAERTADGQKSTSAVVPSPAGRARVPTRRRMPQTTVLVDRYARLLWRDKRNLALLVLQVPLLALAMASLFASGVFDRTGGSSQQAAQLLFLLITTAIWFGAIDAAREVVKERTVLDRETSAGLRLSAYLASKCVVLLSIAALQTTVMATIVFAFRPLDEPPSTALAVMAILVASSWVAVAVGLAISALVRTEDQATSFIPLVLLPQLLFAGALVPVDGMGRAAELVSALMFARWSFAGAGSQIDLNGRIAGDEQFAAVSRFGPDFFDLGAGATLGILALFFAAMLTLAWLLLRRRLDV